MKKLFLIILIIGILFISGCNPICPSCPVPGEYSECSMEGIKTRTNYECGQITNFTCAQFIEEADCATEIKLTTSHGIMEARITPSLEEKVKGIIKVEVLDVPEGTQLIAVAIDDEKLGEGAEYTFLTGGEKTLMIDTLDYENGLYYVGVVASPNGDSPPSAFATTQIIIEN